MSNGGTILIADDDTTWIDSVTRLLEAEAYRVIPVCTGVDTLYQARMRRPDLVLLNPRLRQLSGWEVCRMLKRTPDGGRMKVVMLTLEAEGAYRVGADGYLIKGGQVEPTLPPVRVFSYPVQGILEQFLHRRKAAERLNQVAVAWNSLKCHRVVTLPPQYPIAQRNTAAPSAVDETSHGHHYSFSPGFLFTFL